MVSILVLGYGNTLRGDDGAGWRVAEALSLRGLPREIEVVTLHQLAPELAERIAAADAVLFVDATHEGETGEVRCVDVDPLVDSAGFTHQFSAGSMLQLAREMYGRAPRGVLVSISGEEFDLSERFSPALEAEFPRIVDFVEERAQELVRSVV